MATSGAIIKRLDNYRSFRFRWKTISQSIANNSSVISWELDFNTAGGGAINSNSGLDYYINFNYEGGSKGAAGSSTVSIEANATKRLGSGSITMEHAADGSRSFEIQVIIDFGTQIIGTQYLTTFSFGGTAELDTINRAVTISSASKSFSEITMPLINYTNLSGAATTSIQACISFTGANDDIPYRDITIASSGAYTFALTTEEIETILKAIPNTNEIQVRLYIKSIVDGYTYWNYADSIFTIAKPEPTLEPSVIDTNATTVALTGDNKKLVKYFSNAYFDTGAKAIAGATIKYNSISCGSTTLDEFVSNTGTIANIDSNTFYFSATDTRGYTSRDFIALSASKGEYIAYVPLTANLKIDSFVPTGEMRLTITGKYFNGSFGAQANAMYLELLYETEDNVKKELILGAIEPTVDELNNYSYSYTLTGLNHESNYTVTAKVSDKLTPIITLSTVAAPMPIFEWGKYDFNFNVPVSIKNEPIADFIIEIGQEPMGSNGVWYWAKWSSGKAECYGCRNYGNTAVGTAWGSLYRSDIFTQSYPSGLFAQAPESATITLRQGSYGGWIVMHEQSAPSGDSSGSFMIVRPASATISQAYISFYAVGRWH